MRTRRYARRGVAARQFFASDCQKQSCSCPYTGNLRRARCCRRRPLAAQLLVEPRDARGNARRGGLVIQLQRSDRQHLDAALPQTSVGRPAGSPPPVLFHRGPGCRWVIWAGFGRWKRQLSSSSLPPWSTTLVATARESITSRLDRIETRLSAVRWNPIRADDSDSSFVDVSAPARLCDAGQFFTVALT